MFKITNAKGKIQGYVHQFQRFTLVLWKSGESMCFTGPASVMFGTMVVAVDADGVHAPKTTTSVVKDSVSLLTSHFRKAVGTLSDDQYDGFRYAIEDLAKGEIVTKFDLGCFASGFVEGYHMVTALNRC